VYIDAKILLGCACDIPSYAYTYNFALTPNWPRFSSYATDIHAYLKEVVSVFDLCKYMTFQHEVTRAEWQTFLGSGRSRSRKPLPMVQKGTSMKNAISASTPQAS
jgi:hypothetical protein